MGWYVSKDSTEGLKHRVTKEITVFGKKGQVFDYSEDKIGVFVYAGNPKALKTLWPLALNWDGLVSVVKGGEVFLLLEKCHYSLVKQAISVPKQLGRQVTLANRFR